MKTRCTPHLSSRQAFGLLMVIVLTGFALILATGIFQYAATNANLNNRENEYLSAVGAAEAATEKVVTRICSDFRDLGESYTLSHLDTYRALVPTSSEHSVFGGYTFKNLAGEAGRTDISYTAGSGFEVSSGKYAGLRGTKSKVRIVSNAKANYSGGTPVGSVFQDIELLRVPIFQFAAFYNMNMEFDNGPNPLTITGPVHCNTNIYLNPYAPLIFKSDLTAAGDIILGKMPISPISIGSGAITYEGVHVSRVSALNLPIGTNSTPAAVRELIEIPPVMEDPYSIMGQERYYNKADLIILIRDANIVATSGLRNSFATVIPTTQVTNFISTNASFYNKRELRTIKSTDVNVGNLIQWNATNTLIRSWLPGQDIRTVFIADQRTQTATTESGIRLLNGQAVLPSGFTVATPNPLYTLGHYNAPAGYLGTTNTSTSRPASLVGDAVTILSTGWSDANSSLALASRVAGDTTVNAAILTGLVPTITGQHSGGVQNFPRLLEEWSGRTLTYNGSMVAMFYSKTATNYWRGIGSTIGIYNPPTRNWGLDLNFLTEGRLPPSTPSVTILVRGRWRTPAAFTTNVLAGF